MTKFFEDCKNLDDLKAAYRKAALQYHPDLGGDTATMQAINAEYAARFEVLKRGQNERAAEDTTGRTQARPCSSPRRLASASMIAAASP